MIKPNLDFFKKFGRINYFMPDKILKYEDRRTGQLYMIPSAINEDRIEKLMEASINDGKNYILDLVKENPFTIRKDILY